MRLGVTSLHLGLWMLAAGSPLIMGLSWPCAQLTGSPESPLAETLKDLASRAASEGQGSHYLAFSLPDETQAFMTVLMLPGETPGNTRLCQKTLRVAGLATTSSI